jgi:Domain of Unknown Function (DUF1206)
MAMPRSISYNARHAAHSARHSGVLETLTRVGFACKGVVYLLIGLFAVLAAFQHGGETTDQRGVIQTIATQPFDEFSLAIIGIGLLAYASWRILSAIADTEGEGSDAKGKAKRTGYFMAGVVYAGIAMYAFRLLMGDSGGSADQTQTWTARLMEAPAGTYLVAAAGLILSAAGIAQIIHGWKQEFRRHLQLGDHGTAGHWAIRAGQWGYIARGIVFGVIGALIVSAAIQHSPGRAKGLEGALDTLAAQPFGQWLLAFVGAGLTCYGIYSLIEAKYRRVST